jgi:hypothetical protein
MRDKGMQSFFYGRHSRNKSQPYRPKKNDIDGRTTNGIA